MLLEYLNSLRSLQQEEVNLDSSISFTLASLTNRSDRSQFTLASHRSPMALVHEVNGINRLSAIDEIHAASPDVFMAFHSNECQ